MIPTLNDSLIKNPINSINSTVNSYTTKFSHQSDNLDVDWKNIEDNYTPSQSTSNNMKMDLVVYDESIQLGYNLQTSLSNIKQTDTTSTDSSSKDSYVQQSSSNDDKISFNELNSTASINDTNQQFGLVGLTNLGNTCYMNSGLQCLFNNKKLIYFFLNEYLKNSSKINLANNSLTSCLMNLFKKVWKTIPRDYNVIKPSEFKEIMSQNYSQFQGFRQHDCQEFLILLLGTLHDQINQSLNKSILKGDQDLTKSEKTKTNDINEQSPQSSCSNDLMDLSSRNSPKSSLSVSTSSTYCDQLSEEEIENSLQTSDVNLSNQTLIDPIQSPFNNRLNHNNHQKSTTSTTTISKDELNSQLNVHDLISKDTKLNNANLYMNLNQQESSFDSKKLNKSSIDAELIICSTAKQLNATSESPLNAEDYDRCSDSTASTNSSTTSILKRNKKRHNQSNNLQDQSIENKDPNQDNEQFSSPKRQKLSDSDHEHHLNSNNEQFENLKNEKFSSETEWNKYLTKNKSIIVDIFQGQLKSKVKCSNCLNVSITYEPFMYLPVTLPNALERQIFITYIPSSSNVCYNSQIQSARRYLLTLNKHDKLEKLECLLKELLVKDQMCSDSVQLCFAEVENKCVNKVLDTNTFLKYIDDKNKDLYAYEMIELTFTTTYPIISMPKLWETTTNQNTTPVSTVTSDFIGPLLPSDIQFASNDLKQDNTLPPINDYDLNNGQNNFNNNFTNDLNYEINITTNEDQLNTVSALNTNNFNSDYYPLNENFTRNIMDYLSDEKKENNNNNANELLGGENLKDYNQIDLTSPTNPLQFNNDINKNDDDLTIVDNVDTFDNFNLLPIPLNCAICLEEKDASQLLIHAACSCQLCLPCLDMTVKHCSENEMNFLCPTCSHLITKVDFVPFGRSKKQSILTNYYIIPILFRIHEKRNYNNFKLVSRPILLRLPSLLSGRELYEIIDKFVPCPTPYSLNYTTKSGQKCIRCDWNSHCTGCEISRVGEVFIQPSDCIAVEFESSYSHELDSLMPDALKSILDHPSVHNYKKPEKLTLQECLKLFNQSEVLDDDNPWYCTVCKSNQKAMKSLSIWKAPDTLIVYLKRFIFHDMNSIKIDEPVEFPLENFDISPYYQVDNKFKEDNQNESLIYDLKNIICHSGGVSSGHYTAFSKSAWNNKWYYMNDECVLEIEPKPLDERAYILFYQRSNNLSLDFLKDDFKK